MISSYLFTTLGLAPYLAARAFLPLFASALVARFGSEWWFLGDFLGIELLEGLPAWAVSDTSLAVLGICALAEVLWSKSPEAREMASLGEPWIKGLAALAVAVVLAPQASAPAAPGSGEVLQAGLGLPDAAGPVHLWALLVAGLTGLLAWLRNGVYGFLMDIDEDDDLGIQGFLSWIEDGIGFVGVLFVVVLPMLALIVVGLTLAALLGIRWVLVRRERRQSRPCPHCGELQAPCGPVCARCGGPNPEPVAVGLLGTLRKAPAPEPSRHRLDLIAGKRCRRCGQRLRGKSFEPTCSACGAVPFESLADLERYLAHIRARLPKVLVVLLAFSAVPLVGLIPGVIYYRLSLVSTLRGYIPRGSRILGRLTARLVSLVLVVLQPIPLVGAASLPLLAYANFRIYGRLLRQAGSMSLSPPTVPHVEPTG